MKRKVFSLALALMLVCALCAPASAAQDIAVVIDGRAVAFTDGTGYPFIDENGRTQVPLRAVMEAFGANVGWNGEAAVVQKDGRTVTVPIGENRILIDGQSSATDTAARVINGRTYLPIRAVLEAFGADVAWDNGTVGVTSPQPSAGIRDIFVNAGGDLMFRLANGSVLNLGRIAGSDGSDGRDGIDGTDGKDGKDGRDGVSVTDALVNADGDLIITLSDGRSINAGNVRASGSAVSKLTFADYPVGTRFALASPSGSFDTEFHSRGGDTYTVHFDEIYYELTAKNGAAWTYSDTSVSDGMSFYTANYTTTYFPYTVRFCASGQADPALANYTLNVHLSMTTSPNVAASISGVIGEDGSFSISSDKNWQAPGDVVLNSINVYNYKATTGGSTQPPTPTVPFDPADPDTAALLAKIAGTWSYSPDDSITVGMDGTLTIGGETFEITKIQKYVDPNMERIGVSYTDADNLSSGMTFNVTDNFTPYSSKRYYKDRTWAVVTLTPENFFDYFELTEELSIHYDPFGDPDSASISNRYTLKEEYTAALDRSLSNADARYSCRQRYVNYTFDPINNTYSAEANSTYENIFSDSASMRLSDPYPIKMPLQDSFTHLYTFVTADGDLCTGSNNYDSNFTLDNAQGTLYLINP